jgi:hypothetical protein
MEDNIMAQFRRKLAIVDSIPVLGLMRPGAVLDFLEFLPVDSLLASRGIPHDGMKETLSVGLAEAAFPLPSKSNHKPGARDAGYKPSPPVPKWAKKRDR